LKIEITGGNVSLAYQAMRFAMEAHKDQKRKYTGNPYIEHLADVVAISMSVGWCSPQIHPDKFMATAWLHDCVEDQNTPITELICQFGPEVAEGVFLLSDLEQGNRAQRKALSRERLAKAPAWVQTIKVADLISNTRSIVEHDPKFAITYLEEKRLLLNVLTKADERLIMIARKQIK
jgi:GTP diphosphokinase / guanosine-3',5'-bis(diphosphate) 3'-diphosphatase